MGDKSVEVEEASEELKAWLASLPKKRIGTHRFEFTPLMDQKILLAYNVTPRYVLTKEIGCSKDTLNARYRYLTENKGGKSDE